MDATLFPGPEGQLLTIITTQAFRSVRWSSANTSTQLRSENKPCWKDRIAQLRDVYPDPYPRLSVDKRSISCDEFHTRYNSLAPNETAEQDKVVICGRIQSARSAGSKLIFLDLVQNGRKVQILCNQRHMDAMGVTPEKFKQFYHLLRRGDVLSVIGNPHRTGRGELSVTVSELPKLITPCLHDIPLRVKEQETSPYDRHVQLLSSPTASDILRTRSAIIQYIRNFFFNRSFMEVETPILASVAGGAVARPFQTCATEFPDRPLALRIAPELWLKRLVVGGFDKVFEIGPSFRNEGLDNTHNPEFTTCEFYHAYADLETLISITESLLTGLSQHIHTLHQTIQSSLSLPPAPFTTPFRRLDFIPALEQAMSHKLPNLTPTSTHNPTTQIHELFNNHLNQPLPSNPTLPRLLNRLSSIYLEPQCKEPTLIINHPECLSPLSKSFIHPQCGQVVAARAELFIDSREVMNMYEEENSPFEQRRKFEGQVGVQGKEMGCGVGSGEGGGKVGDESYLRALQWGLPPTGGWGCGVDRLCMLFTGARRIGDVLSFGNLRSVTRSE
ncbi:lysine-tRNA ligase [Paracoccidioides brasiliensis Pb03]|uniref:lysine--tRNA ligase n=1 Tax=Paracoccidioides brasiliensis (strain Pb18) TaxID=502780 RepID=C1G9E5_PARBD|nr:lysine-tRNA ligase [Paracoccidioides brasiliensis Pb18]EEH18978.2 lysine-tRNA ligase [Paracoccidioides brasiliensis Pb03]EEH47797.2 lysine-tRNA ligase [Paracoccidioides brasiliensis Pb18]ODH50664.1 lysine-tRNA ligase [Paracoccidioides brasiliensis]